MFNCGEAVSAAEHDVSDAEFRASVKSYVLKLLACSGKATFYHLLRESLNCDPAVLLGVLRELGEEHRIEEDEGAGVPIDGDYLGSATLPTGKVKNDGRIGPAYARVQEGKALQILDDMLSRLPEASPSYSQWWFSRRSYVGLCRRLLSLILPGSSFAFLGSTTLGAIVSHFTKNRISIMDVDEVLLSAAARFCSENVELVPQDMGSERGDRSAPFGLVFVDPPWGRSLLRAFLVRAAALVHLGGRVVISFPQEFTRPSIPKEREKFLCLATSLGLVLESFERNTTEYAVPGFEATAYFQEGIPLQRPWRRGDLYLFRKNSTCEPRALHQSLPVAPCAKWQQYVFERSRLFLKRDGSKEDGIPLLKSVKGMNSLVHPSTSTRPRFWSAASLISTRNCIAEAYGRRRLDGVLRDLSHRHRADGAQGLAKVPRGMSAIARFVQAMTTAGVGSEEVQTWPTSREWRLRRI